MYDICGPISECEGQLTSLRGLCPKPRNSLLSILCCCHNIFLRQAYCKFLPHNGRYISRIPTHLEYIEFEQRKRINFLDIEKSQRTHIAGEDNIQFTGVLRSRLLRTLHGAFANRLRPGDVVYVPSSTDRSGNRIQRDVRYWQDWLSMSRNGIRENPNTLIDEGGMNAPYREGGSHHISM